MQGKVFVLASSMKICHSKPKLKVYRDGLYPTVTSYGLHDDDAIYDKTKHFRSRNI